MTKQVPQKCFSIYMRETKLIMRVPLYYQNEFISNFRFLIIVIGIFTLITPYTGAKLLMQ